VAVALCPSFLGAKRNGIFRGIVRLSVTFYFGAAYINIVPTYLILKLFLNEQKKPLDNPAAFLFLKAGSGIYLIS